MKRNLSLAMPFLVAALSLAVAVVLELGSASPHTSVMSSLRHRLALPLVLLVLILVFVGVNDLRVAKGQQELDPVLAIQMLGHKIRRFFTSSKETK